MASDQTSAAIGRIDSAGWEKRDGRELFIVRVSFEGPPPGIPFRVIWDRSPVTISVVDTSNGT